MVIHQFGHALGLGHALMKPNEWKSIKEYVDVLKMGMACHVENDEKAFMRQWTGTGVRTSVEVNYDEKSVMQYWYVVYWSHICRILIGNLPMIVPSPFYGEQN